MDRTAAMSAVDSLGVLGYGASALLFGLLAALLAIGWRGRLQGGLLVAAVVATAAWAGLCAVQAAWRGVAIEWLWAVEAVRDLAWMLFSIGLLELLAPPGGTRRRVLAQARLGAILLALALALPFESWLAGLVSAGLGGVLSLRLILEVLGAVAGLVLVEQIFRNTPWQHRWGVKYLCLGVGGLFAFDFFFFADALLFQRIDSSVWVARGGASALAAPLIGVSVARNPHWSFDISVSRSVVFHTGALLAAGVYLLVMSFAGYYIRYWGGEWSTVFQAVFFFGAGLVLLILLFSGQLRSWLKVFVSKHFFNYRYDYRQEWLHLIATLSGKVLDASLAERVIFALAQLVESPGGALWLKNETGGFDQERTWNLPEDAVHRDTDFSTLAAFLRQRAWVVDLAQLRADPEVYDGLILPEPVLADERLWLIVPLVHDDDLLGFAILRRPRSPLAVNWEVMDILKTAARQSASYLALDRAARALADARQFEGFNRLSAFVVHDLKNLIAQLSLVAKNGQRHRANPAFVDDALATVESSVAKMSRLLAHLRGADGRADPAPVDLVRLVREALAERARVEPVPHLEEDSDGPLAVRADPDRLSSCISHVIQNAQEATPRDGRVSVRVARDGDRAVVDVRDTGVGMDAEFVRERLFKPFDSTKGLAGMGVGAYETRELVQALGGRVVVESAPGRGTLFRIWLPLDTTQTAAPLRVAAAG